VVNYLINPLRTRIKYQVNRNKSFPCNKRKLSPVWWYVCDEQLFQILGKLICVGGQTAMEEKECWSVMSYAYPYTIISCDDSVHFSIVF
jgi:hypothetical protein